jgi:peptide/nickel transport system substrate-binding protein
MTATIARAIERRRFIGLSAGALAAAVAGCRPRDPAGSRRSTLIIACPWGERELDAVDSSGLKYLVFLPLLTDNVTGELEGRLAERWEHSPDYREWTFHLRHNIHWHDGVPVTAHDVKFTLELLTHPDVLELGPHDVESITLLDDSTIRVRFGSWFANRQVYNGWEIVLPKHLLAHLAPKQYARWDFWTRPVGNGPYRFVRHVPKTMMQFDANPDYYRGKRGIEHVVLKFTQSAAMAELLSGNVDILLGADPGLSASEASWRAYYGFTFSQISGILWNNAHPLLRDPHVRRALTLAINRRELARVLNLPESFPILDGPVSPRQVRRGELPEPLPYDTEQARALLDAAGWRQRGASGVRERDVQSFHFTLLVRNAPGFSRVAVYVQEAWRRVGVGVDIQTLDAAVANGRVRARQFHALLTYVHWAPVSLQALFGENSPLGYRNTQVVRLLDRLPVAFDPAEDDDVHRQLTQVFRAEVPATFLFPSVRAVFARRRVRGLSSPWRVDPIFFIDELWLDDRGGG